MQNAKPNLVRLNERYIVDLNRVVYVKKDEGNMFLAPAERYYDITIFLDLPVQDKDDNRNKINIYSSKEEEINRILDLITQK